MPSHTEQLLRDLLRHYLPDYQQVHNIRPEWLSYPPTGRNLEIDIFMPEANIAWEADGSQHGRFIPGLQRTFADFVVQQRRDMHKQEACKLNGITPYKLTSFDMTRVRFEPLIRQLVTESEWRRITPPLHLYRKAEKLSRMKVVRKRYRKPGLWPLLQRTWRATVIRRSPKSLRMS